MIIERCGRLQRLYEEEIFKVHNTTRFDLTKSRLNCEPTKLGCLAQVHLTATVLLGHHVHIHCEILITE
jgi:hypothetical protein